MHKFVLVRWKARGAVMGQSRKIGDEDVMPKRSARFLRSGGFVEVLGPVQSTIPRLSFTEEDVEP